jgi:hypothetical protein
MMLGAHSDAFSTGQVAELRSFVETGDYCACGEPVTRCGFWSRVLDSAAVPVDLNATGKFSKIALTVRISEVGLSRTEASEAAAA